MTCAQPDSGQTPAAEIRAAQQFDLRSLLWFTLLVALSLVIGRYRDFFPFFVVTALAAWEAGHTPGGSFLKTLLRNMLALYVCFLAFGAIGFGLMCGENPTGWFGTNRFLFEVFVPLEPEQDQTSQNFFRYELGLSTAAAIVASFSLASEARTFVYVVCWGVLALLIFPLFGSWIGAGWLGLRPWWLPGWGNFSDCYGATGVFAIGGWSALAGILVLGKEDDVADNESLPFSRGSTLLAAGGLLLLWTLWTNLDVFCYFFRWANMDRSPVTGITWATLAGLAGGLLGSLLVLRRIHPPLVLNGGLAGLIASAADGDQLGTIGAAASGVMVALLSVGTSMLLHRKRIPDPAGAISVFVVAGVFGALCAGWTRSNRTTQLLGASVACVWSFGVSAVVYALLRWFLRVWPDR